MSSLRLTLALTAAPLALPLAACGSNGGDGGDAPKGDAVAAVAAPAGSSWTETVQQTADGGFLLGNPNAPIKLIEYGSLSCPHCAKLAQDGYPKLLSDYVGTGKVSLEFRSFAIHPQDIPLTLLAQCGGPQTFFPMIEEFYKNFDAMSERTMQGADAANATSSLPPAQRMVALSDALGFTEFVAARGISQDQARACLSDTANATKYADFSQKYSADGINATPTLVLNGSKLEVATWAELEPLLQQAGAR